MAQFIYNTVGSIGFDMRELNFDALIAGKAVTEFGSALVKWTNATTQATVSLMGTGFDPTVTGATLTELTGPLLTQIFVPRMAGQDVGLNISGLAVSATAFFNLVQAQNWAGLAALTQSGNDAITGSANDDTLLGGAGRDTFVSGIGNDLIFGGAGNDTLLAMAGHDSLVGGKGADQFEFQTEPVQDDGNWVIIRDFKHGTDRIAVSDTHFAHVGSAEPGEGPMDASHFHIGTRAQTIDQGIVYDQAKGLLYYDADGSGSLHKVLMAKLDPGTILTFEDMWLV